MPKGLGTYDFDYKNIGGPKMFAELFNRSPIKYVDNVI